jgi:ATP-dependent 26S proteasome regulatory subunit
MDGFESRGNIKVLMATNRPDTLDPALMRLEININIDLEESIEKYNSVYLIYKEEQWSLKSTLDICQWRKI